jgi:hypothetical protein
MTTVLAKPLSMRDQILGKRVIEKIFLVRKVWSEALIRKEFKVPAAAQGPSNLILSLGTHGIQVDNFRCN